MIQRAKLTIVCPITFKRARAGRKRLCTPKDAPPATVTVTGNVPRISRLMALAIKLDAEIRTGRIRDYADVARLGRVTRARATQIMNLLHLAPDIQEQILFLPRTTLGRDAINERDLRRISAHREWRKQREEWRRLCTSAGAVAHE